MLASDKRKWNDFLCLKGWILFKEIKNIFISLLKDEVLSTSSSSSGWRFNLSPDEWPTASLSEAAEADCPWIQGKLWSDWRICFYKMMTRSLVRSQHVMWYADHQGRKTRQKKRNTSGVHILFCDSAEFHLVSHFVVNRVEFKGNTHLPCV